jgi:hypothetical protein
MIIDILGFPKDSELELYTDIKDQELLKSL